MDDVVSVFLSDPDFDGWSVHWIEMDAANGFKALDVLARVTQQPGPVIVFDCAQTKPLEILRSLLLTRSIICVVSPADSTELWASIADAKTKHESGEPFLPRKLIAAVLLVRKLYRGKYWGGTRNKNFLWIADLAKGRGVSEDFQDIIADVANILFLNGVLIHKGGKPKVALNPERRAEIGEIRLEGRFSNDGLEQVLMKDRKMMSSRILDASHPQGEDGSGTTPNGTTGAGDAD